MGVVAAVVYITIAAIGMAYSARQGIKYGNADMLDAFWPFLIVLNLVNVGFVVRCFGWTNVGFGRLQVRQMVWFLPFLALLAYKWVVALGAMSAFPAKSPEWGRFAYFGAVIVMVGIGEEPANPPYEAGPTITDGAGVVRLLRPVAAIAPADCTVATIADEFRVRVTVRALLPAINAVDPTDPATRVEITEASLGVLDGPGTGLAQIYNRVVFEPVPKTDAHELALYFEVDFPYGA